MKSFYSEIYNEFQLLFYSCQMYSEAAIKHWLWDTNPIFFYCLGLFKQSCLLSHQGSSKTLDSLNIHISPDCVEPGVHKIQLRLAEDANMKKDKKKAIMWWVERGWTNMIENVSNFPITILYQNKIYKRFFVSKFTRRPYLKA